MTIWHREPGTRVGAILCMNTDPKVIEFLGYGEYVGDEVPESAAGGLADIARPMAITNPKIVLDSGQVVWGCECWWSPEDETKKGIAEMVAGGFTVETKDIDEVRKSWREAQNG